MPRNAKAVEVDGHSGGVMGAGEFSFFRDGVGPEHERAGILHGCPCGCGMVTALHLRGSTPGLPIWSCEGEWPNVTLKPSIGIRNGRPADKRPDGWHWHGYLTAGVFEELP